MECIVYQEPRELKTMCCKFDFFIPKHIKLQLVLDLISFSSFFNSAFSPYEEAHTSFSLTVHLFHRLQVQLNDYVTVEKFDKLVEGISKLHVSCPLFCSSPTLMRVSFSYTL